MFAEGRARKVRLGHRLDLDAVVTGAEHPLLTSPAEQGPQRNRPRPLQNAPLYWLQTYLYIDCKRTSMIVANLPLSMRDFDEIVARARYDARRAGQRKSDLAESIRGERSA